MFLKIQKEYSTGKWIVIDGLKIVARYNNYYDALCYLELKEAVN